MKKWIALVLAVLVTAAVTLACGQQKNGGNAATAEEVFDAINAAFAEKYPDVGMVIPNMPMDVDDTILEEKFGITSDMAESYKGQVAGMMTNCDMLIVVKAKDGKLEDVTKALEKAKEDQTAQFEFYAVMGNDKRLEASKIVTNGNFAALLMVGIVGEGAEDTFDFTEDVKLAEDTFNKAINDKAY